MDVRPPTPDLSQLKASDKVDVFHLRTFIGPVTR